MIILFWEDLHTPSKLPDSTRPLETGTLSCITLFICPRLFLTTQASVVPPRIPVHLGRQLRRSAGQGRSLGAFIHLSIAFVSFSFQFLGFSRVLFFSLDIFRFFFAKWEPRGNQIFSSHSSLYIYNIFCRVRPQVDTPFNVDGLLVVFIFFGRGNVLWVNPQFSSS